ncbi:hypothetical protein BGZ73_002370, partial [Actinomortierella ambigua]
RPQREYQAILAVPEYEPYTSNTPSLRTVLSDSVVYQGLPKKTTLTNVTNALHTTIGITDGIYPIEQNKLNRTLNTTLANFEVHFDPELDENKSARQKALEQPITINGHDYLAQEPMQKPINMRRILTRQVRCPNTLHGRLAVVEIFKRLFDKFGTIAKIELEHPLDAQGRHQTRLVNLTSRSEMI